MRDILDRGFGHVRPGWHNYVKIDPRYYRSTEMDRLIDDAAKAKPTLGWIQKSRFKSW